MASLDQTFKIYSQEDLETLQKSFNFKDTDGDKLLSKTELEDFMNENRLDEIYTSDLVFFLCDDNNDDKLSFEEFSAFLIESSEPDSFIKFVEKVFKKIDKDNSGTLDLDELIEFSRLLKFPLDPDELKDEFGGESFKPLTLSEFLKKMSFN
jgi:Ca2+-binding EF-hand superfamily protein